MINKRGIVSWVLVACFLGCASEETDTTCERNSDCPLPEICSGYLVLDSGVVRSGRCIIECRVETDCPQGEFCTGNVCVDPDDPLPIGDGGPLDMGTIRDGSTVPRDGSQPPPRDASTPPRDGSQPPPRDAAINPDAGLVPDMGGVRGDAGKGELTDAPWGTGLDGGDPRPGRQGRRCPQAGPWPSPGQDAPGGVGLARGGGNPSAIKAPFPERCEGWTGGPGRGPALLERTSVPR